MNPSQMMGGSQPAGRTRATAGYSPLGGHTSDDRKIPAFTSAILLGAVGVLFLLDRAKFKMVVGVS